MRVIGVIDLMHGTAVHGRAGRRTEYRPVASAAGVTVGGTATALARVYVDRLGLSEFYVADLDAISTDAAQEDLVRCLAGCGVRVIVDAGITTADDAHRWMATGVDSIIVGLETLRSFEALRAIVASLPATKIAFSLDLREGQPIADRLDAPAGSPEDMAARAVTAGAAEIIVLDIARVGMSTGPDLPLMRRMRGVLPDNVTLLAGGGVRSLDDLRRLSAAGCDGALVATALHDCRIRAADIVAAHQFMRRTEDEDIA